MIHAPGPAFYVNDHVRQRCMWCGIALIDQDLTRIAVQVNPDGSVPPFPTWEPGAFVFKEGGVSYVVHEHETATQTRLRDLPGASCMTLDPAVTT